MTKTYKPVKPNVSTPPASKQNREAWFGDTTKGIKGKPANTTKYPGLHIWHEAGLDEDLKKIATSCSMSSWRDLTEYNWDTRNEKETNWFLHHFLFCDDLTPEGNYMFHNSLPKNQHNKRIYEGVWVPLNKPSSTPPKTPLAKTKPNTNDSPKCDYIKDGTFVCELEEKVGAKKTDCRGPVISGRPIGLGDNRSEAKGIEEIQHAETAVLTLAHYSIHRRDPAGLGLHGYQEESYETVSTLTIDFDSYSKRKIREVLPNSIIPNGYQAHSNPTNSHPQIWTGNEPVEKTKQMETVGDALRILQDAGVLGRVIIRSYTAKGEINPAKKSHALAERRAKWVIDELTKRYGLLFTPQLGKIENERRKKLFTEVQIIPCGEILATQTQQLSGVVVEWEEKNSEVEKSQEPDPTEPSLHCWSLYEFHRKFHDPYMMLFSGGKNKHRGSNGLAQDSADVELFRREALGYIRLIESIIQDPHLAESLANVRAWIQQDWKEDLIQIKSDFDELADEYATIDNNKLKKQRTGIVGGPPWCLDTRPAYIQKDLAAAERAKKARDHMRTGRIYTSVQAALHIMQQKEIKKRIEGEYPVPPLIVTFKKGQPAAPGP